MTPAGRRYLADLCKALGDLAARAARDSTQQHDECPVQAFEEGVRAVVYRLCQRDLEKYLQESEEAEEREPSDSSYEQHILAAAARLEAAEREHDDSAMAEALKDIVQAQRALLSERGESRVEREEDR
jgi:hypothetical protein